MRTEYRLMYWPTSVGCGQNRGLYPTVEDAQTAVSVIDTVEWRQGKPGTSGEGGWWVQPPDGAQGQKWGIFPEEIPESDADRIQLATAMLLDNGWIDGGYHKMWVIDQVLRVLTGDRYEQVITEWCAGEDGPDTYHWDEGIAP